ncbi:hypothetical protein VFPPC_17939 [Pochonia chlamydosporia 170]|uniref:Uncharacterized protein n=1 Tax=Pochonia chlamydosporia 170 TaxID=1380566 RepID=A0A219APY6_METCM|nr:hypothetical protein VFPPC_17939 [Pochonia chlamydosporia 170]OWT42868.1 hypothetical protein VFPPC_17939 [Pochonia chlamydosporia 170]
MPCKLSCIHVGLIIVSRSLGSIKPPFYPRQPKDQSELNCPSTVAPHNSDRIITPLYLLHPSPFQNIQTMRQAIYTILR